MTKTYTVEGMNSELRHYLARFHRKTKCYSKSPRMVILSIYLFMAKDSVREIFPMELMHHNTFKGAIQGKAWNGDGKFFAFWIHHEVMPLHHA